MTGFPKRFPIEGGEGNWTGSDAQVSQNSDYAQRARKDTAPGFFNIYSGTNQTPGISAGNTFPAFDTLNADSVQVNFYSPGVVEILRDGYWNLTSSIFLSSGTAGSIALQFVLTRRGVITFPQTTGSITLAAATNYLISLPGYPLKLQKGDTVQVRLALSASTGTVIQLSPTISYFTGFQLS